MATFRSSTATTGIDLSSTGTNGNLTVNKPTGVVDGDFLVVTVMATFGATIPDPSTVPSGWTSVVDRETSVSGTHLRSITYYKVAASEPASWTWAWSPVFSGIGAYGCLAYSSAPVPTTDGVNSVSTSGGTGTITVGAVSPVFANDLLIASFVCSGAAGVGGTVTGMTNRAAATQIAMFDQALSSSGSTGTRADSCPTVGEAAGHLIAFHFDTAPNTPTMNGTTTYHTSSPGGTASVTLSATTTDPEGDTWFATFTGGGGGTGSTVASGGSSTKTNSLSRSVNSVTATATDTTGGLTSASSTAQTVTVFDIPTAPTINTALDGVYVDLIPIALSATSTLPDDNWYAFFEYQLNGGSWTSIGNGATVATGVASTLTWAIATLPPGVYKVRATGKCATHNVAGPTTTESGSFVIQHGAFFPLFPF